MAYQRITPNTKLTLAQFINLFNDENENGLWDQATLEVYDANGNPMDELDWSEVRINFRPNVSID